MKQRILIIICHTVSPVHDPKKHVFENDMIIHPINLKTCFLIYFVIKVNDIHPSDSRLHHNV
jgi:hypothetical protein